MTLLDSLLDAIIRLDGEALVMHVGERPYVVLSSASLNALRGPLSWGQVELSSRPLTGAAMAGMLGQMLSDDQRRALDELGAIEEEIDVPGESGGRFVVTAARGGEDIWVEVRRRVETVTAAEQPAAVPPPPDVTIEAPIVEYAHESAIESAAAPDLVSPTPAGAEFVALQDGIPEVPLAAEAVDTAGHVGESHDERSSLAALEAQLRAEAEATLAEKLAAFASQAESTVAAREAALAQHAREAVAAKEQELTAALAAQEAALKAETAAALAAREAAIRAEGEAVLAEKEREARAAAAAAVAEKERAARAEMEAALAEQARVLRAEAAAAMAAKEAALTAEAEAARAAQDAAVRAQAQAAALAARTESLAEREAMLTVEAEAARKAAEAAADAERTLAARAAELQSSLAAREAAIAAEAERALDEKQSLLAAAAQRALEEQQAALAADAQRAIAEQQTALAAEAQRVLAAREAALAVEAERALAAREAALAAHVEHALAAKEASLVAEIERVLASKEAALAAEALRQKEREAAHSAEVARLIADKEAALAAETERLLSAKESALAAEARQHIERELARVAEAERGLAEKEAALAAETRRLAEMEARAAEIERAFAQKYAEMIAETERTLAERQTMIVAETERTLAERHAALEADANRALAAQQAALVAETQRALREREAALAAQTQRTLADREAALVAAAEREQARRQAELDAAAERLAQREAAVAQAEAAHAARDAALAAEQEAARVAESEAIRAAEALAVLSAQADAEGAAAETRAARSQPEMADAETPAAVAVVTPIARPLKLQPTHQPAAAASTEASLVELLRAAADRGASMVYAVVDTRPMMRIAGEIAPVGTQAPVAGGDVERFIFQFAPRELVADATPEWTCVVPDVGRVRCVAFQDQSGAGLIFHLPSREAAVADDISLSPQLQSLCDESDGLIVVAGPRSSGKSALLGAFVDVINSTRCDHVISIESQIRRFHEKRLSFISQREVRGDGDAMARAARAALREGPDVLVIEDLRAPEALVAALDAARAGRLVFGSISAPTAPGALERLIDAFPADRRPQVRASLAGVLRAVIAQILVPKTNGGRIAAREILLSSPAVRQLLVEGTMAQLPIAIESGRSLGMCTMVDALGALVRDGVVDIAAACASAPDRGALVSALERDGFDVSGVVKRA